MSIAHSFPLQSNIPYSGYTIVCVTSHLLKGILVAFMNRIYYKHVCSSFYVNIGFHLSGINIQQYNFWVIVSL